MISDFRKALDLEKLDDQIIRIHLSTRSDPRETSHFPTEPKVYGRDQQRDMIIRKFTSEEYSGKNLSVLVIVGHGGVGKTTLAKVVYNHRSVKQHFDRRLWLHVSVYFDEVRLIRDLLESLCEKRYEDVTNLKELQSILGYTWKSNRVLLVLDDVWEDGRRDKWDELLTPLRTNDAKGNTILVTTRKSSVVTMTNATEQVNIGGLHDAAFWGLFKECAFGNAEHKGHRKLKDIGKKIAVKLKGFPLAAKCVGKLLKWKLHDKHWTRILENSEWKDQQGDDDIMPALKISYNYLPRHLQRCFSYCAIFPKNHRYDEERLVNIWIAQGFILSTDQYTRAEEIGNKYLSDLIDWGFFLDDTSRPSLLMHDLIHDLAQIVSSYESFTIEEFKLAADLRLIRHVSVITESAYYGQQDGSISSNECFMHDFARTFCTLPKTNLSTLMLFGAHDLTFASTFQQALGDIKVIRVLKVEMELFLPESLIEIEFGNCDITGKQLSHLMLNLPRLKAVKNLHIEYCDMLQSIQDLDSFGFLKELEIYMCSRLTSVQVKSCTSLQRLSIQSCGALSKLDGELERLCIRECPALLSWQGFESFTGLKHLQMSSPGNNNSCDAPKTEWPELVGCTIKDATDKIKADRPDLNVEALPVGTIVLPFFDPNRVRIWVDTVAEIPKIG
ncbi:hypothetical protein PR202_ga11353 [Eleusine coracana subsp. coracana]|uniref:NB-ARC domain-containing protein n=1 Tax=Eleusine coracana subsp. coracana TaxID=191504 RepID=A0AAV5C8U3_ELECO|nr:hypothetical protein PR202_ga11353 [Eleusine coracana subsp. coracana]